MIHRREPAAKASARTLQLSDGDVYVRTTGGSNRPKILLLHGATVPGWEFDRIVPYLVNAGMSIICPDLYGHGASARPTVRYDHDLFVRQVTELLDALQVDEPVNILGHSLGAAIGVRLACAEPTRVSRLVLTAPLLDFLSQQPAGKLLKVPLLGELMIHGYVKPMLLRRRARRYGPIEDGRFARMFAAQYDQPGFGRALLSLIRNGGLGDQRDCYELLDAQGHQTLILRGTDDEIFSAAQLATIGRLVPRAQVAEVPKLGHSMMMTHPQEVAPLITEYLAA